ncbi:MAG: hypothetical protein WC246_02355 [Candidatus Paceibacterota bacterium]|jgi:hypothetical protein
MKKSYSVLLAVAALVVGFGVGYVVHQPQSPSAGFGGAGSFAQTGRRSGVAGSGNSFVDGQIMAMDATSLTLQLPSGSSQIVLYSTSTPILTTVAGSVSDLATQKNVMVAGTRGSDGSMVAQSIQVRSQGMPLGR